MKFNPAPLRDLIAKFNKPKIAVPAGPVSSLGCDLGKATIVLLETLRNNGSVTVNHFSKLSRPADDREIAPLIKKTLTEEGYQSQKVRIAVKGQGVVVRFVQFPKMQLDELKGALQYEAEKYIPFKYEEVVMDCQIIDPAVDTGGNMNVLLVAVKREDLYPLIGVYKDAGLDVELVDIDSLAFFNAVEFLYPDRFKSALGILDIGTDISTLGIMKEGKPQFIRDISYGCVDIQKRLKRKLGVSSEDLIKKLENIELLEEKIRQEMLDALTPLISELRVSLDYYLDQVQHSNALENLYLCTEQAFYPIILDALNKNLGIAVGNLNLDGKVSLGPKLSKEGIEKNEMLMPIALGLCLRDV
jgi:type IV pilus assembly protein PilM